MWVLVVILALGALLALGEPVADIPGDALNVVTDFAGRGERLTTCQVDDAGVVTDDPDALVAAASAAVGYDVSRDAYALARMCRSEEGSADTLTKVRLCNVAQNQAAQLGFTVWDLMLFHKTSTRAGRFGKQISGRFSTVKDPYESDLAAAYQALQLGDQTGGALNFVDRRAFGVQEGATSFDATVASWAKEGKQPGTLPGSPSSLVFFWRGDLPPDAEVIA